MVTGRITVEGSSPTSKKLLAFLSRRRRGLSPLLILTHDYPDPDALAAACALQYLAREVFGVESRIAYGGVIGRIENRAMVRLLEIPAHRLRSGDLESHRRVALVDTQPGFENNSFPSRRRATLIIDQHASVITPSADLALIDESCGATCVIVAQALLASDIRVPRNVATALAYGILADTLELYRARRRDIVDTYLTLLPHCDMRVLARIRNPERPRRFFDSLAKAIRGAKVRGRLMVSHLGSVENPDLVSQTAEFLLTYERARWVLCTGRFRERLHVSLRTSQNKAAAGEVLRAIVADPRDAGGHGAIAGGSLEVEDPSSEQAWAGLENDLQRALVRRLRISSGGFRKPFLTRG
jgi:nanoRNase/pAp phosphatase (c-di-AMP/oligoRNAs hydrolase)